MTGSPTPGTIVFGINGTTSANQAQESATIANNGSGGAVTAVKTGSGSMYLANANTYSGGTYVLQGQLQANNVGSLGSGPVYVAPGATAFLNGGNATYVNDLYISPARAQSFKPAQPPIPAHCSYPQQAAELLSLPAS